MDVFTTTFPIGALGCIRPDTVSPSSSLPLDQFYTIKAKELARLAVEVDTDEQSSPERRQNCDKTKGDETLARRIEPERDALRD